LEDAVRILERKVLGGNFRLTGSKARDTVEGLLRKSFVILLLTKCSCGQVKGKEMDPACVTYGGENFVYNFGVKFLN
jgi:hypothetical protein